MGHLYLITNMSNGMQYVGQTTKSIDKRWRNHIKCSQKGSETYLHRAIRKYGEDSFEVVELAESDSVEELLSLEISLISRCKTLTPNGYNQTEGGEESSGFRHSEESKEKLRNPSTETRFRKAKSKIGEKNPNFGKRMSEETKLKLSISSSESKTGKPHPHRGHSKTSDDNVRSIRRRAKTETYTSLAKEFDISIASVSLIVNYKSRQNVKDLE